MKATAIISGIYGSGMAVCVGCLYLVPSAFDYWGPAREAYLDGNYEAAVEYYEKILELRPGHFDSHTYRAYSLGGQGDYEGAVASLDEALEVKPHDSVTLSVKSLVLLRLGRFPEAMEVSTQFGSKDSSYFRVQYALVHHLLDSGQLREAEALLRQGLSGDTTWALGNLLLGCVLNRRGRPHEALEAYGRAKALDPSLEGHQYESVKIVVPSLPWDSWESREEARRVAQTCRKSEK